MNQAAQKVNYAALSAAQNYLNTEMLLANKFEGADILYCIEVLDDKIRIQGYTTRVEGTQVNADQDLHLNGIYWVAFRKAAYKDVSDAEVMQDLLVGLKNPLRDTRYNVFNYDPEARVFDVMIEGEIAASLIHPTKPIHG